MHIFRNIVLRLNLCFTDTVSVAELTQCSFSSIDEQEAVQKRTFTKWINSHLAKVNLYAH